MYVELSAATYTGVILKKTQAVAKCKKEEIFRQYHINMFGLFIAVEV